MIRSPSARLHFPSALAPCRIPNLAPPVALNKTSSSTRPAGRNFFMMASSLMPTSTSELSSPPPSASYTSSPLEPFFFFFFLSFFSFFRAFLASFSSLFFSLTLNKVPSSPSAHQVFCPSAILTFSCPIPCSSSRFFTRICVFIPSPFFPKPSPSDQPILDI